MLQVLASRWYIILSTVFAALIVAWWVHPQIPQRYTAEALLRLHAVAGEDAEEAYRLDFADRVMNSYATLLESSWMSQALADRLGSADPDAHELAVEIPANTDLIRLRATHFDPTEAARAANEAASLIAALSRSPLAEAEAPDGAPLAQAPAGGLVLAVFDTASPPDQPSSLTLVPALALAAVLGLIGGTGLAFVAERARQDRRLVDGPAYVTKRW